MNALADPRVGEYVNEYFVSAFQKVATFQIVNGNKQGGNVATYFCAPDGRILHIVAGPVDANTMLKEAKWVVETTQRIVTESDGDGAKFKALYREAHAKRLREEHGLVVEPLAYDVAAGEGDALTYRDPTGRPLAPNLPPPPIDGPDVTLGAERQRRAANDAGAAPVLDKAGRRWVLGNQGRVHQLMAAHSMRKIETMYGTIFEQILGERISTEPVEVVRPFSWVDRQGNRLTPEIIRR